MKVLFACPFVPWPLVTGGKTRTYHLLRAASRSAELHLRLVREPDSPPDLADALAPLCASLEVHERDPAPASARWTRPKIERWFHSASLARSLRRDLATDAMDLLHLDELLLARVPPAPSPVPVVQHHHKLDLEFQRRTARAHALTRSFDLVKLARLEREAARRARHHVLCSDDDARLLAARHPSVVTHVVANGFDPEAFHPPAARASRDPDRLLYLGSMDYEPNVDGVLWFAREVLPRLHARRPGVVLDVVGGSPTGAVRALASERVHVHGRVPSPLPFLHTAALLVVPLRIGGGTRLKIAEALGAGTPVVSTTVGAEGLGLESGRELLLADDPEAFANATLDLLEDPTRAAALAARGRELALARFTWDALGARLLDAWRCALAEPRTAR